MQRMFSVILLIFIINIIFNSCKWLYISVWCVCFCALTHLRTCNRCLKMYKNTSFFIIAPFFTMSLLIGFFASFRILLEYAGIRYIMTNNVIWANPKTKKFVYHWLHAHAMFDVTRFSAFVRALNLISSILLIC